MQNNQRQQSGKTGQTQNLIQKSKDVFESYNKLMGLIEELNEKVQRVLEQHEGQFLLAYQNHVRRINIQLAQIRKKADENEKQMKQSNKMMFLERQITLFRDQSLKLYDRLQEKTHQAEIYKSKALDLEKTCYITQKQIREAMKSKKTLEARLKDAEERIRILENEIESKNEEVAKLTAIPTQGNTKAITFKKYSMRQKSEKAREHVRKSLIYHQNLRKQSMVKVGDNDLKQWFLQCIKTVKKDVASRKNNGYQFDFQEVHSIDDFKMVDKLKLLEKFMENQKLLTWMYEKIFPSRTEEIQEYFSAKKLGNSQQNNMNESSNQYKNMMQQIERPKSQKMDSLKSDKQKIDVMLPKMKVLKSQIRNKISIKEGKLSLSNF